MELQRLRSILILLCWLFCNAIVWGYSSPDAGDLKWLWQIGEFNNDNSEFKLSPNRFSQFDRPGIHVVGCTDPAESWPYILPGRLDTWAGQGAQTFEIIFFLSKTADRGQCRLILDFLDTHSYYPPLVHVVINGQPQVHQTDRGNNDWLMAAADGSGKEHIVSFLVPSSFLKKGENRIEITAAEGSWALWDALRFEVPRGVELSEPHAFTSIRSVKQKQLLVRRNGQLFKPLEIEILHSGKPVQAQIEVSGGAVDTQELVPGINMAEVWIPETDQMEELVIEISTRGQPLTHSRETVTPVRRWEVHLIHQTHLDIGFTHTQEEVLEMQTGYLHQVLDLVAKTKDYPDEARFRWHPEGMWAIDEFIRTVSPEKKQAFIDAVRDQSIHLDAFYVHLLSGLATGEELIELMQPAKAFERKYGVPVRTAIGSDIPGYSWGMVPAMAESGVEFFNMAPNNNHRLGHLFHWADNPFYWLGPDGQSKVLTWMASHAYIYFWDQGEGLYRVPRFLEYLEDSDFPYEIAMLRYEIGGDNGYPDPTLPDKVREWNEKYAYPKLIISTNSRLYDSFTDRYRDEIPVFSGDLTPYWEDGATSTAADLSLNRRAGELLMQARALQALVEPGAEDLQDVNRAWNNIIMYDEHTWGAYCSISDPFAPFTVSQEKYKKAFATEAARLTSLLEKNAAQPISQAGSGIFDVWNTSSYIRDEVVLLTPEQSARGDIIQDEFGNEVISQRLSTGELAFQAKQVPAFASRRYYNRQGRGTFQSGVRISEEEISNENISVGIQRETGAIKSIRIKSTEREVVDTAEHYLNEFIYMKGRESGKNLSGIDTPVHFSILDKGPLVATLSIESGAPGCRTLTRLIRLKSGESKIELINRVDKLKVLEPEGIYFAFPLDIPDGVSRMDIPWGIVRPEADQLQGANRNYYSIQRWMDISNDHFGLTWVTRDAPMMAFSPLTIAAKGRGDSQYMAEFHKDGIRDWWKDSIRSGQSFYSWVMSNHWEVNYKAYQEGSVSFNYTLIPHEGKYDGVVAEKTARSICQPMQVVEVNGQVPVATPPFYLKSEKLVGTSLKSTPNGDAYILRLYNPSEFPGVAEIETIDGRTSGVYHCDPSGIPSDSISGKIKLEGYGLTTLRIDIPEKR